MPVILKHILSKVRVSTQEIKPFHAEVICSILDCCSSI